MREGSLYPSIISKWVLSQTHFQNNSKLRITQVLKNSVQFISYTDFSDLQIFEGATTYPIIPIIKRGHKDNNTFKYFRVKSEDLKDLFAMSGFLVSQSKLNDENWTFESEKENNLKNKIRLGQMIGKTFGKSFYGVKTALNEAFIIDAKKKNEILNSNSSAKVFLKSYLEGKDLGKWTVANAEKWLIIFPKGSTKEFLERMLPKRVVGSYIKQNYTKIAEHLEPYVEKAKARYDQGDFWWELRACDYYHFLSVRR